LSSLLILYKTKDTVMALNALKTKWLLNATVHDATSDVALMEFYIDDILVANVTAPALLPTKNMSF